MVTARVVHGGLSIVLLLWAAVAAVQAQAQVLPTPTVSLQAPDAELPAPVLPAATADAVDAPPPGKRFIVGMEPASTRTSARRGNKLVRDTLTQSGGSVVLESDDTTNPFVVFEADTPEQAAGLVQAAGKAKRVRFIEEDVIRYHTASRVPLDMLLSAAAADTNPTARPTARKLQQTQPYGLAAVQATSFTTAQRSTTSSVNATSKFPICIIDSGFDATHPGLQGVTLRAGEPAGFNTDTCGHGTHVAGTISARTTVDGVLNGAVELIIIKVFDTASCGWTYSSSLTNAMQRCQALGARIISMSLGGPGSSTTEEAAINTLYNTRGVLLIAAAGNDGTTGTSYPAGYANVVSVAAVDSSNAKAGFSQANADVELAAPGVGVYSTIPAVIVPPAITSKPSSTDPTVWTFTGGHQYMTNLPLPARKAFNALAVRCTRTTSGGASCPSTTTSGRVCVIPRSSRDTASSFCTVARVCQTAGGVGVIFHTSSSSSSVWTGTISSTCSITVPVMTMPGTWLSYFPTGARVTNTVQAPYALYSGTSMATPHVSAVAALVWGQHPSCPAPVIRCALKQSALDLGTAGLDNSFGWGLVQAKAAADWLVDKNCTCA